MGLADSHAWPGTELHSSFYKVKNKDQLRLAESPANASQLQCLGRDAIATLSWTYGTGGGIWAGHLAWSRSGVA